jgi:hypothetical protein
VAPYIEPVFELCLIVAGDAQLGDPLRAKAITWLGRVAKMKRKAVANKKMLVPLIQVLFKVVCEMPDSDEVNTKCFENIIQSRFQTIGGLGLILKKRPPIQALMNVLMLLGVSNSKCLEGRMRLNVRSRGLHGNK